MTEHFSRVADTPNNRTWIPENICVRHKWNKGISPMAAILPNNARCEVTRGHPEI
jgi:hypothetical protein